LDPIESIKQGGQPGAATELGATEASAAAAAEAQPQGNPILKALGERLVRLVQPNPLIPEMFRGKWIASTINGKLGVESEEALLGESINLCLDVLTEGSVGDLPPAAHLGWSLIKWRKFKKDGIAPQTAEVKPSA
jgi:hypothetical protein